MKEKKKPKGQHYFLPLSHPQYGRHLFNNQILLIEYVAKLARVRLCHILLSVILGQNKRSKLEMITQSIRLLCTHLQENVVSNTTKGLKKSTNLQHKIESGSVLADVLHEIGDIVKFALIPKENHVDFCFGGKQNDYSQNEKKRSNRKAKCYSSPSLHFPQPCGEPTRGCLFRCREALAPTPWTRIREAFMFLVFDLFNFLCHFF